MWIVSGSYIPAIDAYPAVKADGPDVWFRREARPDGYVD
jgi:hypothetical protein